VDTVCAGPGLLSIQLWQNPYGSFARGAGGALASPYWNDWANFQVARNAGATRARSLVNSVPELLLLFPERVHPPDTGELQEPHSS
jgi:hypothetical protein